MTIRQRHRLLRHNTIDKNELEESILLDFTYKDKSGDEYQLTVYPGNLEFSLKFPNGAIVNDSFQGLSQRKILYSSLDEGLYSWLKERQHSIELVESFDGIQRIKVPMGYAGYHVAVDTVKKKGWILFPEYTKSFDLSELYLHIAELPLIDDGRLNHILRAKLEGLDLRIPDTPYEIGYSITHKE